MTDTEIKEASWELFAFAHPHEAYEWRPKKFWEFFHKQHPNISHERMLELLKETEYIP